MGEGAQDEQWLQRLIAGALSIGIGKRELMEDYYMDEIGPVIGAWNEMHDPERGKGWTENVDAFTFLGEGGEQL